MLFGLISIAISSLTMFNYFPQFDALSRNLNDTNFKIDSLVRLLPSGTTTKHNPLGKTSLSRGKIACNLKLFLNFI